MGRKRSGSKKPRITQALGGVALLTMDGETYGTVIANFEAIDSDGNPFVGTTTVWTSINGAPFAGYDSFAGGSIPGSDQPNLVAALHGGEGCQSYAECRDAQGELWYRGVIVDWNYSVS